jgi:hypothetical protein
VPRHFVPSRSLQPKGRDHPVGRSSRCCGLIARPARCTVSILLAGVLSVFRYTAVSMEGAMHDPAQEQAAVPYNPDDDVSGIEQVLRQHEGRLLARPGVTGVAIGKSPTGDPAIVIYLQDQRIRTGLPKLIDGYPVVTQVTGPIEAQRP